MPQASLPIEPFTIRPYVPSDKEALLHLLALNTPGHFAPEERNDFENYLEKEREIYLVICRGNEVIGCGGINYFLSERLARISWDIVHPKWQGKGAGRQLLDYRLSLMAKDKGLDKAVVRTSQLAYLFYEKAGFHLEKTESDFWAPGLHLYQMHMDLMDVNIR